MAGKARALWEVELNSNAFGITPAHKSEVNFHDFCKRYIDQYTNEDKRMVHGSYVRFVDFLTQHHPQLAKTLRGNQPAKPLLEEYKDPRK